MPRGGRGRPSWSCSWVAGTRAASACGGGTFGSPGGDALRVQFSLPRQSRYFMTLLVEMMREYDPQAKAGPAQRLVN